MSSSSDVDGWARDVVAGAAQVLKPLARTGCNPSREPGINVTQHLDAFGEVTTVTT
jgi:hypothetical protein